MVSDQNASGDASNTNGGEKNRGESEYVELRRGSDGHKVSEGDTVWVDVDARAKREDPDERNRAPRLIDDFEAKVVEVRDSNLVLGGEKLELELDNGDRISIGDWFQCLDRDFEHYCHEGRDQIRVYVEINDESEVATGGGVDVADGPGIDDLHERVQAAMRPYVDEILEAEYTSLLAEDDENWFLSVHWGEWDTLLSDGILTSDEYDAISSEYHSIVSDEWRNDDPENRWSNAAPYGDGYALVLQKPEAEVDGDNDEGSQADIIDELHDAGLYADVDVRFEWSRLPEDSVRGLVVGLRDDSARVLIHGRQEIPAGEYVVKRDGTQTILTRTLSYDLSCVDKTNKGDESEVATDGGKDEGTPRDRAWLAVIDLLAGAQPMTVGKIADGANVHENTARAVLHVAEAYGVLSREKEHSHTYGPTIGPLGDVTDPEYRRAIRTLIAEAKQED